MEPAYSAHALIRFGMNSPDALRLLRFYVQAFGAHLMSRGTRAHAPLGAHAIVIRLGDSSVELLQFDAPGKPYPDDLSPYDPRFQHLCIVVTDMQRAMQRLSQTVGWSAISTAGPQTLPDSDGGVTAFKFRDPDGHPLELLQFAAGQIPAHWQSTGRHDLYLGIDHSAISVTDAVRSLRFYASLGLHRAGQTRNHGPAQERLDGVPAPVVDVISLTPPRPTPHLELLCYHSATRPAHEAPAVNDIAATRLVFAAASAPGDAEDCLIQDPDGHFLQFE